MTMRTRLTVAAEAGVANSPVNLLFLSNRGEDEFCEEIKKIVDLNLRNVPLPVIYYHFTRNFI